MLTLAQMQDASREAAIVAAQGRRIPLIVWPEDVETPKGFRMFCRGVPNLGSYRPVGWTEIAVDDLADYPYKWFFVDNSGFGCEGEHALTPEGFRGLLKAICEVHGYSFGIAIVEAGEFQVQLALFRAPDAPDS